MEPQKQLKAFVLGITPFERPDPAVAVALCRAGAAGILDLGRRLDRAREALQMTARVAREDGTPGRLGVRLHVEALLDPEDLPDEIETVLLPAGIEVEPWRPRRVLVRVTSLHEAKRAEEAGADGLIAVGSESGGAVGEESALVLFQRIARGTDLPIWVQGGIGPHTAAACMAGGAAGVVLEGQLALVRESTLSPAVREVVRVMDGSETGVVGGYRVYARPMRPRGADRRATRPDVEQLRDASPGEVAALLGAQDPERELLPTGQDAAFARLLAERYETAAGVVRAIREAALEGVRAAREVRPLAPGAPLGRSHGTRYPILQGPMTRVSDRAPFAAAVARAGALPFLALSLLRGDALRDLLAETAAFLADRPWGVGILGFVPSELRREQLAAIAESRPPYALIAGGRPSQARGLEERGIATYLHVPSGGLLDLFLKEGARRFVFEGRECGGHVGPLSSFALWQTQIERLLAFERPEELSVVFAGGIGDARAAAMVSAMAAPLAARGSQVGILMGTAYLFTKEVVETGAVVSAYQREALACRSTALLETGPGHATRCVDTRYARAFREERRRLEAEGYPPREVWARLERLNLGRLRMASKGLVRVGEELRPIDEAAQRSEGMYMIGQVAALREEVTTIEDLHREMCQDSLGILEAVDLSDDFSHDCVTRSRAEDLPAGVVSTGAAARRVDVAIVGMAAHFPQAADLDQYWANIVDGVDAITEVPRERWDPDVYYDPQGTPGRTTPSKWGGFIDEIVFDPARYGIPPRSLAAIDPIQLLSLEVARRALDDAGYGARPFDRERTAVIFGAEGGTDLSKAYGFRAMWPQVAGPLPSALDEHLPVPTEDSFPGVLTNVISGRIANRLDLGGENYTVNAACASSLAALAVAAQWLAAGTCDMAVVGGADVHNSIGDYLMFSSVHALSKGGRCRTFDSGADGITLGEGVGALVVKRLSDAERDGDRIYAVLKGIGGSSDGKSLGLTAPRLEGQQRALRWAYRAAGVSPAEIGLMEAHGTGTVVGDRTELQSMESVFAEAGAEPGACTLSSVKSQIGHTKAAAGIASLIKAALCLHHRVLPPTLHVERPNPQWDPARSPFTLSDRSRPWIAGRRAAAVSAFGFGGTNYHAVLVEPDRDGARDSTPAATVASDGELAPERPLVPARAVWPAELFVIRGTDREAALERLELVDRARASEPAWTLRDLARSASTGGEGPVQAAFIAADVPQLAARIARARSVLRGTDTAEEGEPDHARVYLRPDAPADGAAGPVAFLFPGQGSQYVGMLADLFVAFAGLGDLLAAAPGVAARMHPPKAFSPVERQGQEAALTATEVAQVAIGICDAAMARVLAHVGVQADMLAGHSYGEMAALFEAGAWDYPTLLDLSAVRARAILEAAGDDPGAMAAVQAGAAEIEARLGDLEDVVPANLNAPRQTILSGPTAGIEAAIERLTGAGIRATRLNVACAFHSGVVADARIEFGRALAAAELRPLRRSVWSNATAQPYPIAPDAVRALLADQLARPVRFADQVEAMYEAGARVFVEVGPGRVLTGLVDRTLADRPHVAVPTDVRGEAGLVRLLVALARLAAAGVDFDAERLFEGRGAERIDLAAPPARSIPPTAWIVNGHWARPAKGPVPPGAYRPSTGPLLAAGDILTPSLAAPPDLSESGPAGSPARERAILEYLRNLRQIVEAQREVMLKYLGAEDVRSAHVEPASLHDEPPRPASAPRPLGEMLLAIVAERTGYPIEMLDLDLDLEADLSIDSIKRIEILGALNEAVGLADRLGDDRDELLEELAAIKTLRGIEAWIGERAGFEEPAAFDEPAKGVTRPAPSGRETARMDQDGHRRLSRFRFRVRPEAPTTPVSTNGVELRGRSFILTDDGRGVAPLLAERLRSAGAEVRVARNGEALEGADALVHLAPLSPAAGPEEVKALYRIARPIVSRGAGTIVGVTGMGGGFGHDANGASRPGQGGVAGFLKSLAKEWPRGRVRAVDLDPEEDPSALVEWIWRELASDDGAIEVGYARGERRRLELVEARPSERAPANRHGSAECLLDAESVVLVTGGARGIAARLSVELARRYRCRLELVGRSPIPSEEERRDTAGVEDPIALRSLLARLYPPDRPARIEARWRALRAEREIRATLAAIREAGADARYHAVDVRDEDAFGARIDEIYERHGRLDGAVHAAGTIEDKLLVHKTAASFDRVFDTKVAGGLTLTRKLRDGTRFVVFFSSVVGAFGNRGQTDYAAANDVLDKLALHLRSRLPARVLSINWGPWDGSGMVTPTLRREYARRGVSLIQPEAGVASLLEELARDGDAQIVLTRGAPVPE